MARDDEECKALGARLRGARTLAKKTTQEVADILKDEGFRTTKQAVNHWETGVRLPDIFVLKRLAKLYGQSLDALVFESAVSMEAMQIAASFEGLEETQKRTLRAVWLAFVTEGASAADIDPAPALNVLPPSIPPAVGEARIDKMSEPNKK